MDKRQKAVWLAHADRNRGKKAAAPKQLIRLTGPEVPPPPDELGTELPPITFPPFAKKYLGEQAMTGLVELTKALDEYELLLLRKSLSMEEVIQYLAMSGDMEAIQRKVIETHKVFAEHSANLTLQSISLYGNKEKAFQKVLEATRESVNGLSLVYHRVILGALWSDAQSSNAANQTKQALDQIKSEMPTGFLLRELAKDPLYPERVIVGEIIKTGTKDSQAFALPMMFFMLRLLSLKPRALDSDPELDRIEGDEIAEKIRRTNIVPGSVDLPKPEHLPEIERVVFSKSNRRNPLMFGGVTFYFKDPKNKSLITSSFNISRLNGDICLPSGMLTSPEPFYAEVGQEELFLSLRAHILRSLQEAIRSGALTEEVDDVQQRLEEVLEEINEERAEPGDQELEVDLGEVEEPKGETGSPEQMDPGAGQKEKRDKAVIKTLAWEKTKSALERLGVTFKKRGAHYKMYRKVGDRTITCSFPNEHTKPGTLAWIVKTNLKILELTPQEFLNNLK